MAAICRWVDVVAVGRPPDVEYFRSGVAEVGDSRVEMDVAAVLEWRTAAGVVCPSTVMGVGVRSGREVARAGTKPIQVAARPPTPRKNMLKTRTRCKGTRCRRSAGWC